MKHTITCTFIFKGDKICKVLWFSVSGKYQVSEDKTSSHKLVYVLLVRNLVCLQWITRDQFWGEANPQARAEGAVYLHGNLTEYENTWKTTKKETCRGLYSWKMQFLNYSTSRNTFSHTLLAAFLSVVMLHITALPGSRGESTGTPAIAICVVSLSELNKGYCICSFILSPPTS